ncbi:putative Fe-containing alcohol dehydrogenase [Mycena sanguinolenta]|nr:putative Fe-containing alcohol dehydrogenase [Mycena sanguinolenta]
MQNQTQFFKMTSHETLRPAVPPYPGPLPDSRAHYAYGNVFNNCDVSFGVPFATACAKHAEDTFHATRIFILSSATLANSTSALADLKAALGAKVAGVKFGFKAHTYFSEIFETVEECRRLDVDLIVTLGGGSLSDFAKMITFVLANNVHNAVELLKLPTLMTMGTVPPAKDPTVPVICISTTLSGGEFTLGSIRLVILDAQLVIDTTPPLLFLQSGVRAIDHCIEALCSPYRSEVSNMHAKAGLEWLVPGLLRCKDDGDAKTDVEARLLCQRAAIDAVASIVRVYTPVGGSHAIGHILGPFGVVHGATSAILLPATDIKASLCGVLEMRRLAESKGLVEGVADLGDVLDALLRELGMARTLREVGVGQDKFDKLAEFSLGDPFALTNPVPLKEKAQVMEILEMVAE